MKLTKDDFALKLIEVFPEKEASLRQHYIDYGELYGHIFFSDEISIPLFDLLLENETGTEIRKYCCFVEDMWRNGTEPVVNVVDVTIAERLSDNITVWKNFGKNISDEFIEYINKDLLVNNLMMNHVTTLKSNNK